MRLARYAILVLFWGCRSTVPTPAGAVASARTPLALAGSVNLAPHIAVVPLRLVALGTALTLNVLRHAGQDSRIHVAGRAFAAHADGEGALEADSGSELPPDPPFDPRTQTLSYAGVTPNLLAFRRKNVPCLVPDDGALLALQGKKWRVQRLPGRVFPPHAFLEWAGGALLVDSQIQACGWATSSPVEQLSQPTGTVFTEIAPTGALSHPTLGLDSAFMAWGASSADQSLALVGTYGVRAGALAPAFGSREIVVMRRHGQGSFKASVIVHAEGPQSQSVRTRVQEFGSAALLWPPPARDDGTAVSGAVAEGGDESAWKGHASSIFRIADDGTSEFRFRSKSEQDCHVEDAALVGKNVYAIVACPDSPARLILADPHNDPERVELPSVPTLPACSPVQVTGLSPDNLWVRAECGPAGNPKRTAIFRRGPPQEPLLAP